MHLDRRTRVEHYVRVTGYLKLVLPVAEDLQTLIRITVTGLSGGVTAFAHARPLGVIRAERVVQAQCRTKTFDDRGIVTQTDFHTVHRDGFQRFRGRTVHAQRRRGKTDMEAQTAHFFLCRQTDCQQQG